MITVVLIVYLYFLKASSYANKHFFFSSPILGGSSNGAELIQEKDRKSGSPGGSDSEVASQRSCRRMTNPVECGGAGSSGSDRSANTRVTQDVPRLDSMPPELTGSAQSFRAAMGNPCEFFVNVI